MTIEEKIGDCRVAVERMNVYLYGFSLVENLTSSQRAVKNDCEKRIKEYEQLAGWLEELKALRLLLDWAIECDFGFDNFPNEYEKYKHTLNDDMSYTDKIKQIALCVIKEDAKEELEDDD